MSWSRCWLFCGALLVCGALNPARTPADEPAPDQSGQKGPAQVQPQAGDSATDPFAWQALFDGESLTGWEQLEGVYPFKKAGEVQVVDGEMRLAAGQPGTGIRWKSADKAPRVNYEIEFQARRTEGSDFFTGLTFPVRDEVCTLIVGGWGGGVVGLSNVDGRNAEENETMKYLAFKNDQWYTIRLRVTEKKIQAFIDEEPLVDLNTEGRKFTIWSEQEPAAPLGISSWHTAAALRKIRLRRLSAEELAWQPMFDGRTLDGWKSSEFASQGDISAEKGRILISFADGCNGVTYQGEFPRREYELRLEAMRVDGSDFFCGLTFPVGEDYCSLIVGGWGGTTVGLSSLDGKDAARNETRQLIGFKTGQWYPIHLRVAGGRITVQIDGKQVIDVATEGRKLSIRPEVERSRPLGICSWCTTAALRKIEWRDVKSSERQSPDPGNKESGGKERK